MELFQNDTRDMANAEPMQMFLFIFQILYFYAISYEFLVCIMFSD